MGTREGVVWGMSTCTRHKTEEEHHDVQIIGQIKHHVNHPFTHSAEQLIALMSLKSRSVRTGIAPSQSDAPPLSFLLTQGIN
jgi:hypothetical protein